MVAQGLEQPPAKKCTCRKVIAYKKADDMVKKGEARWCVVKRERGTRSVTCTLCGGDPEVKNCAKCAGFGAVTAPAVWDTYNTDIVRVSQASIDEKEKKYRPALAMKTPRVATIESEHISRAYNGSLTAKHPRQWTGDGEEARDRIEEYGMLVLEARTYVGKDRLPAIKEEPVDDQKTRTGREYDWGRAI